MKRYQFLFHPILLRILVVACAQCQVSIAAAAPKDRGRESAMQLQMGTAQDDFARVVASSAGGNFYIAGHSEGSIYRSAAKKPGLFVSRFDKSGAKLWGLQIGAASNDDVVGATVDGSNNIYIAGASGSDVFGKNMGERDAFTAKISPQGKILWHHIFATKDDDAARSIVCAPNGRLYIAGVTRGSLDGSKKKDRDEYDVFLSCLSEDGSQRWLKQYPGGDVSAMAVGADGSLYITGESGRAFNAKATLGPGFASKIDSSGNIVWSTHLTSRQGAYTSSICVDAHNNVYIGGATNFGIAVSGERGFVAMCDRGGHQVWMSVQDTVESDVLGLAAGKSSVYAVGGVTGSQFGREIGGGDAFVAEYGSDGRLIHSTKFGTLQGDAAYSVDVDQSGSLLIAGGTAGALYGRHIGAFDIFVRRIQPRAWNGGGEQRQ